MRPSFSWRIFFWVLGAIGLVAFSGFSGGLMGHYAAVQWVSSQASAPRPQPVTTTASVLETVERRPLPSWVPPSILARRQSSVGLLIKRTAKIDELIVNTDRVQGLATVVTADGWFVTSWSAWDEERVADIWCVFDGKAYPIQKAIHDKTTDAVFFKIAAINLPVTSFTSSGDVIVGTPVWIEARAKQVSAGLVSHTHAEGLPLLPVNSDRVIRRFGLSTFASTETLLAGTPVWDERGQLLGIIADTTKTQLIPGGILSAGLSRLLAQGEIRYPTLGVTGSDLTRLAFEEGKRGVTGKGFWLRPDRRLGLPAVLTTGPAAKLLKEGDVIERIERDVLDGETDLAELLLSYKPGTTVEVGIRRADGPTTVNVTLGSKVASVILK